MLTNAVNDVKYFAINFTRVFEPLNNLDMVEISFRWLVMFF